MITSDRLWLFEIQLIFRDILHYMEAILSLFASINALAEQINAKMIHPILSTKLEVIASSIQIIKNIITEVSDSALLNQKDAPIEHSFSQKMSSWEH